MVCGRNLICKLSEEKTPPFHFHCKTKDICLLVTANLSGQTVGII